MYTIEIFEQAMNSCSYKLDRIKYMPNSLNIQTAEGRVLIREEVRNVTYFQRFRWDASGHCFSFSSNKRFPQYDLPLQTILESKKQQEIELFIN